MSLFCPFLECSIEGVREVFKSCTVRSWRSGKSKQSKVNIMLLLQLTEIHRISCVFAYTCITAGERWLNLTNLFWLKNTRFKCAFLLSSLWDPIDNCFHKTSSLEHRNKARFVESIPCILLQVLLLLLWATSAFLFWRGKKLAASSWR